MMKQESRMLLKKSYQTVALSGKMLMRLRKTKKMIQKSHFQQLSNMEINMLIKKIGVSNTMVKRLEVSILSLLLRVKLKK
jgi:hypothetical protein